MVKPCSGREYERNRSTGFFKTIVRLCSHEVPAFAAQDASPGQAKPPIDLTIAALARREAPVSTGCRWCVRDSIACSHQWQVQSAEIDRTARAGRTPSDHFPVQAILRYK